MRHPAIQTLHLTDETIKALITTLMERFYMERRLADCLTAKDDPDGLVRQGSMACLEQANKLQKFLDK